MIVLKTASKEETPSRGARKRERGSFLGGEGLTPGAYKSPGRKTLYSGGKCLRISGGVLVEGGNRVNPVESAYTSKKGERNGEGLQGRGKNLTHTPEARLGELGTLQSKVGSRRN